MISDLVARARALLFRRSWDADLDEELRFHVEQDASGRIARGVSPADARREARLAIGGVDAVKERVRDASGVRPLQELAADTRFAVRALRRNPGFTLTAVVVLSLAIGAATSVYAVVDAVLISQLPYPRPDRLVRVFNQSSPDNRWGLSIVDYQAIRDQQRSFGAFGILRLGSAALTGAGEPEQMTVARVTPGYMDALGVRPAAGRLIASADETAGAPPVVIVSHALATERLGGTGAAVGRSVMLDGVAHTVIGVLPLGVEDLAGTRAEVWPVLQSTAPPRRGPFGIRAIGRLRDGVTHEAAARDLAGISERIFPLWEASFQDSVARFVPQDLRTSIVGDAGRQLRFLAGAVLLVLLVGVVNVATLALVRAAAREHELATRARLGATRARLARLVATENLIVMLLAGAAGVGVAAVGLGVIGSILPWVPRSQEIALDSRALVFALLVTLLSAALVSLSPIAAVLSGRFTSDRGDGRRAIGSRRANAVRGTLVAAEFALALPLLVGAALLVRSFARLQQVDPGYDPSPVLTVTVSLPSQRYPDSAATGAFWARAVQRARETPGVSTAAFTTSVPPNNGGDVNNFRLIDRPLAPGESEPVTPWVNVTPDYFEALGIRLLDGRLFTPADSMGAPPVAIVSRAWAAHYLGGEPALGRRMISGGCTECPPTTIVGVVSDVKYLGLAGDGDGVYAPLAQSNGQSATLVVRTAGPHAATGRTLLATLRALDPELPLAARTLVESMDQELSNPARLTRLIGAFAAVALALAALGMFGLMSYVVQRQRREIGVRMALGAEPRHVVGMIVGRGLRFVALGAIAGLALAALGTRSLESLLYGVAPRDPATLGSVLVLLVAAASAACLLPALRATRIRPIEAIASE